MAVTQNTYTGNGSTTNYSFTFPYLEETDIKVTLNGTTTTAYTLANATTIQFNTAPVNGAAIRIYRVTDDAALSAQFYPGSAIRSTDLNDNFTQNLYVTQESNRDATQAITTADAATATANTALSNSSTAVSTANAASASAAAAVSTANTASTNASAAVATANTASTNASAAVTTANSAAADAATAISAANGAVTTANSAAADAATAISTANTASSNASAAVATANTASTNASNAVTTANTASTAASNAVTTANSAVTTANAADSKADQAISAVANALLFTIVANVAAIPGSPADGDAVEVTDATGIESFTPLSGLPSGFVGDSGLGVRIIYQSAGSTWVWLQYFPQDPDNRYAGPNTAAGTAAAPSIAFGPTDLDTGIYSPGADQVAVSTGGTERLSIDASGSVTIPGIVVSNTVTTTGAFQISRSGSLVGLLSDSNSFLSNDLSAGRFIPTDSTVPTNGVYLPAANTVGVATNGTGRVFVDASGRVGIGTSNPSSRLHLEDGDNTVVTLGNTSSDKGVIQYFNGSLILKTGTSIGDRTFQVHTSGSERLRITDTGLVGIGTSSVGARFHIEDTDSSSAYSTASILGTQTSVYKQIVHTNQGTGTNEAGIVLRAGTSSNIAEWGISALRTGATSGDLVFRSRTGASTSAEFMRLTSTGLGIGTSAPSNTLHVNGTGGGSFTSGPENALARINATTNTVGHGAALALTALATKETAWIISAEHTSGNNGDLAFYCYPGGASYAERMRIDSSGRLLVGTSTAYGSSDNLVVQKTDGGARIGLQHSSTGDVTTGEELGAISFYSNDGDLNPSARISAEADSDHAVGDKPGRLVFSTTADGASSPAERLRIANTGAFGLSGANYGSSGQVLTSQGSGSAPQWATPAGGAWRHLATRTASSATTVEFTSLISATYTNYVLIGDNVRVPSGWIHFELSRDNGSTYSPAGTNYYTGSTNQAQETSWYPFSGLGGQGWGGHTIYLYNLQDGNQSTYRSFGSSTNQTRTFGGSIVDDTSTWTYNAFRLRAQSAGNLTGTFKLYGISDS